jgi:hypothetical protein
VTTKFYQMYHLSFGHLYLHSVLGTFFNYLTKKMRNLDYVRLKEVLEGVREKEQQLIEYEKRKEFDQQQISLDESCVAVGEIEKTGSRDSDGEKSSNMFKTKTSINVDKTKRTDVSRKIEMAFDVLFSLLLGSLVSIPDEIKFVMKNVSRIVQEKFGVQTQRTFIVGYFFLRYLCPALAIPQTAFSVELTAAAKAMCLLVSKILQVNSCCILFMIFLFFFKKENFSNVLLYFNF